MESLIQKRDELIRQITFLNQRESELSQSCTEKGQLLAQITADIDKMKIIKREMTISLKETLDEIKEAQASIVDLVEELEQ